MLRRFPVDNSFNFLGVNRNALGRDNMAKIEDFIKPEFTFGELRIETLLTEPVEDQTEVLGMVFFILR